MTTESITDGWLYQRVRSRYATGKITHEEFAAAVEQKLTDGTWDADAVGLSPPRFHHSDD